MSGIVMYQDSNNQIELNVHLDGETVWLTQKQMSELFDTTLQNITMHLKSVFSEGDMWRADEEGMIVMSHLRHWYFLMLFRFQF